MPIPDETYREKHLLPSILSADFSRLGEEVSLVMDAGRDHHPCGYHGRPFRAESDHRAGGPQVDRPVGAWARRLFLGASHDREPGKFLEEFVEAGADAISVHVEACPHLYHAVTAIKALGAGAGVAINPGTPVSAVREVEETRRLLPGDDCQPGFRRPADDRAGPRQSHRGCGSSVPEGVAIEVDGGVHRGEYPPRRRRGGELGGGRFGRLQRSPRPGEEARRLQDLMRRGAQPSPGPWQRAPPCGRFSAAE